MEETLNQESVEGNKRKIDHVEEDLAEVREWFQGIRADLLQRDSACLTLCCLTEQEFSDEYDLGQSIVVGADMIFCCGYTGIIKEYATIEEAADHISDKNPEIRMWCFYGNYYDFFVGYDKKSLEGPWYPEDIIPVIREAQAMLKDLEKEYDKLDQTRPEEGHVVEEDLKPKFMRFFKGQEEMERARNFIPNVKSPVLLDSRPNHIVSNQNEN